MGTRHMQKRSLGDMLVRSLITLVISACIGGPGSGLIGITGGDGGGGGNGAPPVLAFFTEPGPANAGDVLSPVEVVAQDSVGGTDSTFSGSISIALTSNSTGATLGGTTTRAAVNGTVTFNNLVVDRAGTYTLQASASGAASITTDPFTITTPTGP